MDEEKDHVEEEKDHVYERCVISRTDCDAALREAQATSPIPNTKKRPVYERYNLTPACLPIVSELHQKLGSRIAEVKPNGNVSLLISASFVGKLLPDEPDALVVGRPHETYITLALTPLNKSNGWVHFIDRTTGKEKIGENPDLDVGDAVIWRGDTQGLRGEGDGGFVLNVTYG